MKILIVRTDKLGDFITTLPAIYLLKKHNPKNEIVVCVAPLNVALAKACDFIDVVVVDNGQSLASLASELRALRVDASITMFSNTRVAFAQFLASIPIRIAPATKIAQIFYNKRVKQRRSQVKMAEFEYNIELCKSLFEDMDTEYKKPLLEFEDAKSVYDEFKKEYGIKRDVVAFHVGFGGSSDANWNLDEYEKLIDAVLLENKYDVVLTFGPDEQNLCDEMQKRLEGRGVVFYVSKDGLVEFAKLISNFKLFVSTSTGTYHLASLVGTATMTFFADSLFASAKRWKSVGDITKQKHYMIPLDVQKREKLFDEVKRELEGF